MAFAERILPRASGLWVQASPDYKPRLQQRFFPEGIAFDGNRFNRTAATARFSITWRRMRLIRFRGHLLKGGYDVHTDGRHSEEEPAPAPAV